MLIYRSLESRLPPSVLPAPRLLSSSPTVARQRCTASQRGRSFAAHKHRDQRRKDSIASPYINHPIALAQILTDAGITDAATLSAAILHDVIEDTETTVDELRAAFGDEICDLVMEVTDDKNLLKEVRKSLQIEHAHLSSDRAKLVKLADKIANLRDQATCPPANWSLERRQTYFDWAKQVVDKIRGTHTGLAAMFDEAYTQKPA